jgi:transcriptional regulator with XRE-family HTH domain
MSVTTHEERQATSGDGEAGMGVAAQQSLSPQARGRELARQGKALYIEYGSVNAAARELMNRHQDLPSIQAFRYAAGLSQDQAAARYNEVAGNQTTLGGTTINAWESWARARGAAGAGSPPSFASLLILATAYGRGPHGTADEPVSPGNLVQEAYEKLAPEDQLALRTVVDRPFVPATGDSLQVRNAVVNSSPDADNAIGPDFDLPAPTIDNGNPAICAFSLPNPRPGELLDLSWNTFGFGVQRLMRQIKSLGRRLDADICFGVNEAGLVMATFLASAQFGRCSIGYLKCNRVRNEITFAAESHFPETVETPTIVICDFEVKHADVVGVVATELRQRYPGAELYFAVFGAMTKGSTLEVESFDDLTGARIMQAAEFEAVFIAATMNPPGIEPPLELR